MSFKIMDNTELIIQESTIKASIFLRKMSDEIVNEAKKHTPKKTGRLRIDIIKQVLGLKGKLKWGKSYAVFQETKQFKNYTTPGTGPHFAENAVKNSAKKTGVIAKASGLI